MPSVVILGAGVMGASLAWHLTSRGCRDVRLLDRGAAPGAGSTSRATGGFRAQYATAINVRLSLLAREKLLRFSDEVGGDCGYVPAGYLWLASSQAELDVLREARVIQHAEGLDEARAVTPEDITRLNPAVACDDIIGGAYCPTDGFIRPLGILQGYLDGALRYGATVDWGAEATGLERDTTGRITAVSHTHRTGRRRRGRQCGGCVGGRVRARLRSRPSGGRRCGVRWPRPSPPTSCLPRCR